MPEAVSIAKEPRKEDFTHKFRKGEWAEALLLQTLNQHEELEAIHYGVSRDDTLYTKAALDNVKEPGVEEYKRPDILVFRSKDLDDRHDSDLLTRYNKASPEHRQDLLPKLEAKGLIDLAVMAIEAEASRFNISERPNHYDSLSTYVKSEDYPRLANWGIKHDSVPMYVCQLFFDCGYIVPFDAIETHADAYRETGAQPVNGFDHDWIPQIHKEGYVIDIESYPGAIRFGTITEQPRVVKQFDGEKFDVDYSWTHAGKLEPEKDDPHFHDGKFSEDARRHLARYAFES